MKRPHHLDETIFFFQFMSSLKKFQCKCYLFPAEQM